MFELDSKLEDKPIIMNMEHVYKFKKYNPHPSISLIYHKSFVYTAKRYLLSDPPQPEGNPTKSQGNKSVRMQMISKHAIKP